MATRVRLRYILMTPLNCLTLKTPIFHHYKIFTFTVTHSQKNPTDNV